MSTKFSLRLNVFQIQNFTLEDKKLAYEQVFNNFDLLVVCSKTKELRKRKKV